MRYAARTDNTQREIFSHLTQAGYDVLYYSRARYGIPDLLAYKHGIGIWVECKSPGGKLTRQEKVFFDFAPGDKVIAFGGIDAVTQCELILRKNGK